MTLSLAGASLSVRAAKTDSRFVLVFLRGAPDGLVLDPGVAVLRANMAEVWSKTAILLVTEFGRTVRVNGAGGTDHGTGTAAFLPGGAVAGGHVLVDWPGLEREQLFEDRDLQPTLDIRAIAKGILGPHLGLSEDGLATVFPGGNRVSAKVGLLKT